MGAEYYIERIVADQTLKERDELKGKLSTAKTFINASILAIESGSTEAALELLKQIQDLLK